MRALALVALVCALAPACAADAVNYRKAAQNAASNLDVQQSLPDDSTLAGDAKSHSDQSGGHGAESGVEAPALRAVWGELRWVLLILVVASILGFVVSQIAERRKFARPIPSVPSESVTRESAPRTAEQLLAEADRCALEGLYRDAMHFVLLAAMSHVVRKLREAAPDSATSWELMRAAELQPSERTALRDLLMRTDRAWFGEYVSGVEDYQDARHCFQTFLSGGKTA